jgi:hypothetical protein
MKTFGCISSDFLLMSGLALVAHDLDKISMTLSASFTVVSKWFNSYRVSFIPFF